MRLWFKLEQSIKQTLNRISLMKAGAGRPCFFIANFPLDFLPTVELLITKCIVQFCEIQYYGKKHAILGFRRRPQDVVVCPSLLQPRPILSVDEEGSQEAPPCVWHH